MRIFLLRPLLLVIILIGLLPLVTKGQAVSPTRAELEQQRTELQKEIEKATQDLSEVQRNKRRTITQLQVLENKVRLRNKLIANINQEINYINGDINKANKDIQNLQGELDTLRAQYAQLIVYAYKNRSTYDFLTFILSANSFNDAIKRFEYLKQYREYRENQASSIIKTQNELKEKVKNLAAMKVKRSSVLDSEKGQRNSIEQEKKEKDAMVSTLKGHESELLKGIKEKRKESQRLSVKIDAVIRREIEEAQRKAAEAARQRALAEARARAEAEAKKDLAAKEAAGANNAPAAKPEATPPPPARTPDVAAAEPAKTRPTNVLEATPAALALSESFESNRGKLPWPVSKAIITSTFGIHKHPVLDKVTVDNDGVTMQTEQGAQVHAVFAGEVAGVFPFSNKWTVIIRHGQYFTVYSNLKDVSVQRGQQVSTMQSIGTVYTDSSTGESDLEFKVYKSTTPVDPQLWLRSM
jgi:septal ring factor EnvC (AmiA/AmiB activator)